MKIYELKFRTTEEMESSFSMYFSTLALAMDYIGDRYRFGVHSKLKFIADLDDNFGGMTFLPDFRCEAIAAGRTTCPYYIKELEMITTAICADA